MCLSQQLQANEKRYNSVTWCQKWLAMVTLILQPPAPLAPYPQSYQECMCKDHSNQSGMARPSSAQG